MRFLSFFRELTFYILLLVITTNLRAQSVAITMDNPNSDPTPLLSPEVRDQRILSILKKNHVKIVLFAQGAQVDNQQGRALLERWNNAGHILGNHTYSHLSINEISEEQYEADTFKNEKLLQHYSQFKKIFRFPFLKCVSS